MGFIIHKGDGDYLLIKVDVNVEKATGVTSHISCDTGCTATDKWSLESAEKSELDGNKSS